MSRPVRIAALRGFLDSCDADDDARASLLAALDVVEACADWIHDIGECHFCQFGDNDHDPPRPHREHCPMRDIPIVFERT